jgi:NAD(P)-dependent dehydrogenase (short-subunit alcohol dehydrogenase family)
MTSKGVLITGCSSGFGLEMVERFLEKGWIVVATLRNASARSRLFETQKQKYGARLKLLSLDVTSEKERADAVRLVDQELSGRLDCLVNNAGYGLFGSLEDISERQLREQMEVNFFGTALMTRALLPALRRAQGRVINLSSVFGFTGFPLTSAYCASKFAVEGLTESLRVELAPHGIQVCAFEPGGYRTRFADSVLWGENSFSDSSAYLTPTRGYQAFKEKLSTVPHPAQPADVARSIVKLAGCRTMPARMVSGKDAGFMALLRHQPLGSRISEFLLAKIYRRFIAKGTSPRSLK